MKYKSFKILTNKLPLNERFKFALDMLFKKDIILKYSETGKKVKIMQKFNELYGVEFWK